MFHQQSISITETSSTTAHNGLVMMNAGHTSSASQMSKKGSVTKTQMRKKCTCKYRKKEQNANLAEVFVLFQRMLITFWKLLVICNEMVPLRKGKCHFFKDHVQANSDK